MDSARFDDLSRRLGAGATRRTLLTGLTGGLAALGLGVDQAAAKRKKCRPRCKGGAVCKRGKCKCRRNGQSCTGNAGCCGALICRNRACQPNCDVCANGCEFATLGAAVAAAGPDATITVCPGTYADPNPINLTSNVTIQGAGDGVDATTDTILTYSGNLNLLQVNSGVTATLRGVRLVGTAGQPANGINNEGNLTVEDCTVTTFLRGVNSDGSLSMNGCTVTANDAGSSALAGGLFLRGLAILTDCVVSDNSAQNGGGLYVDDGGSVTLNGTTVRDNTAVETGGGIFVDIGVVNLFNSTVSDNDPDNCVGNVQGPGCAV